MNRTWGVLLLAAAVGCGGDATPAAVDASAVDMAQTQGPADAAVPSPFLGTWKGNIVTAPITCSDGDTLQSTTTVITFEILSDSAKKLYWHAKCGDIYLSENGNTATQTVDVSCPPTTDAQGVIASDTIKNFTLVLSGNALMASYTQHIIFTGASPTATCIVPTSGTLVRQ